MVMVKVLLRNHASIKPKDKYMWTPLHFAASKGHTDLVELLLGQGASTEAMQTDKWTPLHFATQ